MEAPHASSDGCAPVPEPRNRAWPLILPAGTKHNKNRETTTAAKRGPSPIRTALRRERSTY